MLFDGTVPAEAANVVFAELKQQPKIKYPNGSANVSEKLPLRDSGTVETDPIRRMGRNSPFVPVRPCWRTPHRTAVRNIYRKPSHRMGQFLRSRRPECLQTPHAPESPARTVLPASRIAVGRRHPDAFCGSEGVLEVKCPSFKITCAQSSPAKSRPNTSTRYWDICGFPAGSIATSFPRSRISGPHGLAIVRVDRKEHEGAIDKLAERIAEFHELLIETLQRLKVKPGKNIQL